jgi:hypothetical protein
VQGEVGDEVVADPVFGAADAEQGDGPGVSVGDDGEASEVEADVRAAVLELEAFGVVGHVAADGKQPRGQLLAFVAIVELCFKSGDGGGGGVAHVTQPAEFDVVGGVDSGEDGVDAPAGKVAASSGGGCGDEVGGGE